CAAVAGPGFAFLLVFVSVFFFVAGDWFAGLWLGLIGMFLNQAATGGYEQVLIRQYLSGEPVARFMTRQPIVVPPDVDLRHWVDDYVYRYHRKMFPVTSNGHVEGVITT